MGINIHEELNRADTPRAEDRAAVVPQVIPGIIEVSTRAGNRPEAVNARAGSAWEDNVGCVPSWQQGITVRDGKSIVW